MSGSFGLMLLPTIVWSTSHVVTHGAPRPTPKAVPKMPRLSSCLSCLSMFACRQPLLPLCRLEISSLNKTIRITAKSTKRIREALQPVLGKYGVSMELALLRRVRTHTSVGTALASGSWDAVVVGPQMWGSGQGLPAVTRL